jgi:hypothetical protein
MEQTNPAERRDLPTAGEVFGYPFADDTDEPVPMTGAEALDAARTPDEFLGVMNGVFDAIAQASRDEADREDGAR